MADSPWVPGAGDKQIVGGAFSAWPAATPKYATNAGKKDFKESMARMYLWLDADTKTRFDAVMRGKSDRTQEIAKRIAGTENTSGGFGYVEFLLQAASHSLQENIDVVETLADEFASYSFGQQPPVFQYAVELLNNKYDDQAQNMFRLYRDILRASALASLQTEVHLQYDGMIVSGVMMNFSWSLSAADESHCPGSFSLLVREVTLLDDSPSYYDNINSKPSTQLAANTLASLLPVVTSGVRTAVQIADAPAPAPEAAGAPASAEATRGDAPVTTASTILSTTSTGGTYTGKNGVTVTKEDFDRQLPTVAALTGTQGAVGLYQQSLTNPVVLNTASDAQKAQVNLLKDQLQTALMGVYKSKGGT